MEATAETAGHQKSQDAHAEKFLILPIMVLILAQMGTSGDNGALSLATSALTSGLGATMPDIQLANMVYSLVAGALMVAGGLMGTIIGWRKNFRIGAALCAVGELIMAFSPTVEVFIWGGRLLVGLGASFMIPSVLGLIPRIYSGKNRVMAFGCIGAATGLSTFLPLIFGIIMQAGGFRITFGILGIYFLLVLVLSLALPALASGDEKLKFDIVGTLLSTVGLFLLLMGLSRISAWGLVQPFADAPFSVFGLSPCLPLIVAGIVALGIMIKLEQGVEKRNGIALLPHSFIANTQVLAGLAASAITFLFMLSLGAVIIYPYLQLVSGWSATAVGVLTVCMGIPMVIFSMGIPRFFPRANPRRVLQVGYVTTIVSIVPLYLAIQDGGQVNEVSLFVGFALVGVGCGMLASHTNNVVALALNERDAAQSGGVQATSRNVGQAIGVALLGTVLLFGISAGVNALASQDSSIGPAVSSAIADRNVTLMSDDEFKSTISDIPMTDAQQAKLLSVNAAAHVDASHVTLIVTAVILLLGLLTTPFIKTRSKTQKKSSQLEHDPGLSQAAGGTGD